jgi:hypothetical protein
MAARIGSLATGVAAGVAARRTLRPVLQHDRLTRTNRRGRAVQTASGVVPLAVGAAATVWPPTRAAGVAGVVMGAAGLVDDVWGDRRGDVGTRGFAGHLRSLRHGQVTTGAVKIAGGVAGGLCAATLTGSAGPMAVVDGAVVALAANLGNLLDRAPGRTAKVAIAATAGLAAAGRLDAGAAVLVGATVATMPDELAERSMLGDTGANLVGAAVGVGLVAGVPRRGRITALVVLVGLTLASERWSFSAVIDRNPLLRAVDRWGRTP